MSKHIKDLIQVKMFLDTSQLTDSELASKASRSINNYSDGIAIARHELARREGLEQ